MKQGPGSAIPSRSFKIDETSSGTVMTPSMEPMLKRVPYWFFQFTAILIHRIVYYGDLGTIILRKKLPFVDITRIYCTVWTLMLGEAMLQVACDSSNSQN